MAVFFENLERDRQKRGENFMGMFAFLKEVGEKIFGGSEANAEELKKTLDANGLGDGVEVTVNGDQVELKGNVKDQATLEKIVLAAGNNAGVAAVKTDGVSVSAPAEESVFYTVKKGDTLWKIAETQYGKGKGGKYNLIFEANTPMLKHPDKIYPGQVLRIPPLK